MNDPLPWDEDQDLCGCGHDGNIELSRCRHQNVTDRSDESPYGAAPDGIPCCRCGGDNPTLVCDAIRCTCVFHSDCNDANNNGENNSGNENDNNNDNNNDNSNNETK